MYFGVLTLSFFSLHLGLVRTFKMKQNLWAQKKKKGNKICKKVQVKGISCLFNHGDKK